ncbi:MAG: hypothetical protein JW953_09955 [Anaerolineae bacterium]|nr:hypothetical protein [Anaerolineae bacterium]
MMAANPNQPGQQSPLPAQVAFNINYYAARAKDYLARHKTTPPATPPDYYLAYGDKYVRRFTNQLRPKLSSAGQAWLDLTGFLLQWQMEQQRKTNPVAFARLEENPAAFRQFAYSTHAEAYIRAGIADLSLKEWCLIALTPDPGDILCPAGIQQVLKVAGHITAVYCTPVMGLLWGLSSKLRAIHI